MVGKEICQGYKKTCTNKQKREGYCANCLGEKFREQIMNILRDIWDVLPEKEKYIEGSKCDIYIEKRLHERVNIRYYIECKDVKPNVGVNKINEFLFNFIVLKIANEVDLGIFISRFGFTSYARDRIKSQGIITFTFDELEYLHNIWNQKEWSSEMIQRNKINRSIPEPAIITNGDNHDG